MRNTLTALLLAGLLLLTTGCTQQTSSAGNSAEDNPAAEQTAPEGGFAENAEALYDFGTVQISLPVEVLDQLIVETGGDDCEADRTLYPRTLMRVYEKASVEAAEADYGDGAGFGFLWGFGELDQAALEDLLSADPSGVSAFAQKGELYYAFLFPTDVQFYRSGDFSAVTEEDWQSWEVLNELGKQVREDFMVRNGLTPVPPKGSPEHHTSEHIRPKKGDRWKSCLPFVFHSFSQHFQQAKLHGSVRCSLRCSICR